MSRKLSLITPLYNTPLNYLEEIKQQILPYNEKIEWVLVIDSPFNKELVEYVDELKRKYEFIKVHSNIKNLGIYKSYVAGYELASGDYCGILDHDDHLDLDAVVAYLEAENDFDLLYTNEYKFDDQNKFDFFDKPQLDILSTVFYFYTHHITLMRTQIVKRIVKEYSSEKYSSIFDICLMLDYLREFKKSEINVVHIDSYSYGWRVHQDSTALNIDQKPAAHIERIMKVEEFFKEFDETPIVSIDKDIQYLVCSEFFSGYDLYKTPFTSNLEEVKRWFDSLADGQNVSWIGSQPESLDLIVEILRISRRVPFKYLLEYTNAPILIIPRSSYIYLQSEPSYQRHLPNVPFIMNRDLNFVAVNNLKGLLFNAKPDVTKDQVNIIVIK
ncbi:glycosyltransferase [Paenibacillus bouchesdurhonensis]|uniref:glycosyltransferase n=1 Tax=Paenibacillus bouchesdurhonensis TaxID=1870990 RepID=UPI000DA6277C|nr:glycosyltransferase [Paenibacillus bouchesdurhonensis]